jgi:hypothetical protein
MVELVKSWGSIESYYNGLAATFAPASHMANLAGAVSRSCYARALFAWTSMLDLCVTQNPATYPYSGPILRITPPPDGSILFRYEDTWEREKQWSRLVPGEAGFATLEHFLSQLGWFDKTGQSRMPN